MSVDREYRIKITQTADTSGAREQGQALDNLSDKTKDYIRRLNEGRDAGEAFEAAHHVMRTGMRMLGPEMVEIGHLAHGAFFGPMAAGLLTLTFLVGKLLEQNQKWKEAVATAPSLDGIHAVIETLGEDGMLKALRDAEEEFEKFWRSMNRGPDRAKNALEEEIEQIKNKGEVEKKVLDASEKQEMAVVEAREKAGLLDKDQAEREKARIQRKYEAGKASTDEDVQRNIIAAQKHTIESAPGGDEIGAKQKSLTDAQSEVARAQSAFDEHSKAAKSISDWFEKEGLNADTATRERKDKEQTLELKEAERAQRDLSAAKIKEDAAKADLERVQKQAQDAEQLKETVKREQGALDTQQGGRRQVQGIQDRTAGAALAGAAGITPRLAQFFESAIGGEEEMGRRQDSLRSRTDLRTGQRLVPDFRIDELTRTGQLSAPGMELIPHLVELLRQQGNSQERIQALLSEMKDLHVSHAQKAQDLAVALRQLKARVNSIPNNPT